MASPKPHTGPSFAQLQALCTVCITATAPVLPLTVRSHLLRVSVPDCTRCSFFFRRSMVSLSFDAHSKPLGRVEGKESDAVFEMNVALRFRRSHRLRLAIMSWPWRVIASLRCFTLPRQKCASEISRTSTPWCVSMSFVAAKPHEKQMNTHMSRRTPVG